MKNKNKQDVLNDIFIVLTTSLSLESKVNILSHCFLWAWSEWDGKYYGCKYFSEKALEQLIHKKNVKDLRHEHVIPRKELIKLLLELPQQEITIEYLEKFFNEWVMAAVITKEEDKLLPIKDMPTNFYKEKNIWGRYQNKNIKIYEITWEGKNITEKKEIRF